MRYIGTVGIDMGSVPRPREGEVWRVGIEFWSESERPVDDKDARLLLIAYADAMRARKGPG